MSAYFITACGTGIGKTFATCALIHAAQKLGCTINAYKPVISGFTPEDAASDTARIAEKQLTLIEGVGGVMVPLTEQRTVRDWMAALRIPAILVTGSYLGSISHTLTAIEALRAASIPIHAIIVSESEASPVPLADTLATIRAFAGDVPHCIAQPRVAAPQQATAMHALLEQL